jgi:peptidoglycan hydrolase CwlO-like protein
VFNNASTLISGLIALAGAVAIAIAYGRGALAKNIIELQKSEIAALRESNQRLTDDRQSMLARINTLEGQIKTLQGVITQGPQIARLAEETLRQHNESMEVQTKILEKIGSQPV